MRTVLYVTCFIAWIILTIAFLFAYDDFVPSMLTIFLFAIEHIGAIILAILFLIAGTFFGITEVLLPLLLFIVAAYFVISNIILVASAIGAAIIVVLIGGFFDALLDRFED